MKLLTTVIASLLTSVLARSSVHIVSNGVTELETKPEVSLSTFSMFYAHMMDATSQHPVLQLQNSKQVQDISPMLPETESLFEKKTDANLMVIIAGVNQPEDVISQYDTSFYVTDDDSYKYSALVEDIVDNESKDIALTLYKDHKVQFEGEELPFDQEKLIENFNNYFIDYKTELFDIEKEADLSFVTELEMIRESSQLEKTKLYDVRILEVNSLQTLGEAYGIDSDLYKEAQLMTKDLFEKVVIPTFQQLYSNGVSTLVLTPYSQQKRMVPAEGEACFKSASACVKGTDSCSGNGQCALVKENCYACQCNSSYVGKTCQYVNAVNDFQLLFWTSALLIVITTSVVVCVYQSGSNTDAGIILTQSAPKQD